MYLTSAAWAPRSGIAVVSLPRSGGTVGEGAGAVGEGASAVSFRGRVGVGVGAASIASMTSRRRIDPPGPDPFTRLRSTPRDRARSSAPSLTSTVAPPFGAGVSTAGAFAGAVGCALAASGGPSGCAGFACSGFGCFATSPSPPTSISASAAPTVIVCPASARIFSRRPLAGAGTSASTLSVVTSTSASPSRTESPGCFSHFATVPSVTDSPISGRVTCIEWGTIEFYPASGA